MDKLSRKELAAVGRTKWNSKYHNILNGNWFFILLLAWIFAWFIPLSTVDYNNETKYDNGNGDIITISNNTAEYNGDIYKLSGNGDNSWIQIAIISPCVLGVLAWFIVAMVAIDRRNKYAQEFADKEIGNSERITCQV